MSHLPKSVTERLRASVSPVGHPDPDVLTAFSERSLPAHERAVVMEHLARCSDCRDVVALALPAMESVQQSAPAAHADWFRWPVLRWGAVAAGLAVFAAIGIQHYRDRSQPEKLMARNAEQDGVAIEKVAKNEAPKAEMPSISKETQPAPQTTRDEAPAVINGALTKPAERLAPSSPAHIGASIGGPFASNVIGGAAGARQLSNNQQVFNNQQGTQLAVNTAPSGSFASSGVPAAKQAPSAPPEQKIPSVSETVEVESASDTVASQTSQVEGRLDTSKSQPAAGVGRGYSSSGADKTLSKAKAATQQVEVSAAAPAVSAPPPQPALNGRKMAALGALNAPTWTISSIGTVQRSFDRGKTWQEVDVTANSVVAYEIVQTESVAAYDDKLSRQKKNKKDAKAAKQSSASPIFRAVAANGPDVWAGGSAGLLFHSADTGDHWIRVFPISNSGALTADITSIQFSDADHGSITTAASEVWTTTDQGRTWQKH